MQGTERLRRSFAQGRRGHQLSSGGSRRRGPKPSTGSRFRGPPGFDF